MSSAWGGRVFELIEFDLETFIPFMIPSNTLNKLKFLVGVAVIRRGDGGVHGRGPSQAE